MSIDIDGGDFSGTDPEVTPYPEWPDLPLPESVALLRDYLGASDAHTDDLLRAWSTAYSLCFRFVGTSVVPPTLMRQAIILVAAELYERRQSPNGLSQFATPNGVTGVRVARDPMLSAYPILRPFTKWGIA